MLTLLLTVSLVATFGHGAKLAPLEQQAEPRVHYDHISSCPEQYGLQTYPHPDTCHGFYKCANGTLTEELCEHGLLYDGTGNVHNHCNYHWAVNCEGRYSDVVPHESGPCEYDFGIFAVGACETYYHKCQYGEPIPTDCTPGLAYDERTHSCNWPDLMLETCNPEQIVGFSCPEYLDPKSLSARFLPFPRFPSDDCSSYIVCVDDYPRRVFCGDYNLFDEDTLSCQDPKDAVCKR